MKALLLSLSLVACAPKTAELTSAEETEALPSAVSLFERNLQVSGTKESLVGLENLQIRSVMRIPAAGIEGEINVQFQTPNLLLVSQSVPGIGAGTVGFDGQTAWSSDNMVGPRIIEGKEREEFLMDSQIDSDVEFAHWYPEMKTIGLVEFNGVPTYQVEATTRFDRTDTKYFDPESGLILGESYAVESPLGPMNMVVRFDEWVKMEGILMPRLTQIETGPITMETEILSVEKNQEIAEGLFALPPEIQELLDESKEEADSATEEADVVDEAPETPAAK
jgi:hypothetical protein